MPPKKKSQAPEFKLTSLKPIEMPSFQMPVVPPLRLKPLNFNFFQTPIQNFAHPNPGNQIQFNKIPTAMWLMTVSYLPVNDLFIMMLTCKSLGEITNQDAIRSRLGLLKFGVPKQSLPGQFVSGPTQKQPIPFFNPVLNPAPIQFQQTTVCQPGPNGFIMQGI